MTAEQLIRQYHTKTITARELVEGVWDNAATRFDEYGRWLFFTTNALYHAFFADSLEELYAKGAEFTIARLVEVANFKKEIALLIGATGGYGKEDTATNSSILAREQSALAELSRGLKPEVLK